MKQVGFLYCQLVMLLKGRYQALVFAHADPKRYESTAELTRSVLFLATPHGGSKTANVGSLLSNVAALTFQYPPTQLLEALQLQSPLLSRLSDDFCQISSSLNIVNFYERRRTSPLKSLASLLLRFNEPDLAYCEPTDC